MKVVPILPGPQSNAGNNGFTPLSMQGYHASSTNTVPRGHYACNDELQGLRRLQNIQNILVIDWADVRHDPNAADTVPDITLMWLDMCAVVSKLPVPVREGE
jgi:hypothetical protein